MRKKRYQGLAGLMMRSILGRSSLADACYTCRSYDNLLLTTKYQRK